MTTYRQSAPRHAGGFTLIEVVVVLAVLSLLLGTALPLAGAIVDGDRRTEVQGELATIATALESYYYDRGAFPVSIRSAGFFAVYLQPGVNETGVSDAWGGNVDYLYSVDLAANSVSVWSRGEDGADAGFANEEFGVSVFGSVPGLRRTRERMRVIVEAMALYLESGGTLSGTWTTDRAAIGLGASYDVDGFGANFDLDAATLVLRSAGPDRVLNTTDDVTT